MQDFPFPLVVPLEGEPRASSEIIANGIGQQHASVIKLVRRHERRFERFGKIRFEIRLNRRGKPTEFAMLNEQQATLLLAFMSNTEKVMDFKEELVAEFFRMRDELGRREQSLWQQMQALIAPDALTSQARVTTVPSLSLFVASVNPNAIPAAFCEPSLAEGFSGTNAPLIASTSIENSSPASNAVAPAVIVHAIWLLNAVPAVATPSELPYGSATLNVVGVAATAVYTPSCAPATIGVAAIAIVPLPTLLFTCSALPAHAAATPPVCKPRTVPGYTFVAPPIVTASRERWPRASDTRNPPACQYSFSGVWVRFGAVVIDPFQ